MLAVRLKDRVIASGSVRSVRILIDYRPALRERTGVGEYVHQAATALVASAPTDESLTLFSASWKDRLAPNVVPGALTVDLRIPVKVLNLAWHRLGWPSIERLTRQRFDIVETLHPLLMPSIGAARLVTVHDLDFLDHPDRTRHEIRRDYGALVRRHTRRADQVIVNSHHTAQQVRDRLGVPPSHISVCEPGAPAWPKRSAEPATGGCILFVGTLEPRKNLEALLDAYVRLRSRRTSCPPLVLAGRITPEARPLQQRAAEPQLAGHVEFTGYVPRDRLAELFARALIFVLPSHTEGFGMSAVEAMMAGVPVVAADRGALVEVVGEAGRLVDPADSAALAMALEEILDDRQVRQRMSDEGRVRAERFTWASTAHKMREAWSLALAHHHHG
jgi:glycosyltransferase involved in cell wall biosynthesis